MLHRAVGWQSGSEALVHLQHLGIGGDWSQFGATLSPLSHLTYLSAESPSVDCLYQLGALTNLQELHLLTDDSPLDPTSVPGLAFPASLTKLKLSQHPHYPPAKASVLSLLPTGLRDMWIEHSALEGPAEGSGSLLYGIADCSI